MADMLKVDVYELLNISVTADEKEIKRAYRKKALTCHPDKNPDNPKAADLFQQLTKALEILTDSKARAAYDQVLRAKKAAAVRNRELDSKRKRLKEDLEAREKAALNEKFSEVDASKKLQVEIERLRKEGSKLVEEEKQFLHQQILREMQNASQEHEVDHSLPRLKIRWTVQNENKGESDYTEEELKTILEKHGHVTCLLISSKKKGSAIVEFSTTEAAESAFKSETGKANCPLKLSWISEQPDPKNTNDQNVKCKTASASSPVIIGSNSTLTSRDYESLVLMKLRQAEERKKLIQQIEEEEKNS